MFERPHHQRIARILQALDPQLLTEAKCYFGGGTAIVLQLGEYRESVDIDFLCSDKAGYRMLREAIAPPTLGRLLCTPVKHVRDVRTLRDKISTFLEVDGTPIRIEFLLEGRIDLEGAMDSVLGVPVLSQDDLYTQKLLANADRALDRSVMSRDLIDLAMMIQRWGPIPAAALEKAEGAYGKAIGDYFERGLELLGNERYRSDCLKAMGMDPEAGPGFLEALQSHSPDSGSPPSPRP